MRMSFEDLKYERDGEVATVTLDRPDARNAYSEAMVQSLVAALDQAESDAQVRCVALTGAGSAFCAGGDLQRLLAHAAMQERPSSVASGPGEGYQTGCCSRYRSFFGRS